MSIPVLLHAALQTALISLPTVIEARRGSLTQAACDVRLHRWATRLLLRTQVRLEVVGLEHISSSGGPFVVVSNHQSHYDIPALYAALPLSLRMAAKSELFRTPLWGQALRAAGFVEIDRSTPRAAFQALRQAGATMRELSISLYIAPEGTRSDDGSVGHFKKGAFDVARITQLPLLPVAIDGTRMVHRKGSRTIGKGCKVRVQILPPIPPTAFDARDAFAENVRSQIIAALA